MTTNVYTPTLVKDLVSKPINYIAAGWNHSLVLSRKGDIYASGYGLHGLWDCSDHRLMFTGQMGYDGLEFVQFYIFCKDGGNKIWKDSVQMQE